LGDIQNPSYKIVENSTGSVLLFSPVMNIYENWFNQTEVSSDDSHSPGQVTRNTEVGEK
jgi:hypothetical protein